MNNLLLNERSLIYHLRQYRSKRRLHYFAETESTNEVAKSFAATARASELSLYPTVKPPAKAAPAEHFAHPRVPAYTFQSFTR